MTEQPLVSICCITYNHAPYIKRALDAMLAQNTLFNFEIVLADDCSTDGTAEICKEYAAKYPDIIKLIVDTHNVGVTANERRASLAARGKYIAFCEGDDYWTDPYKLQKQVDFLESHPDYSVTFHRYQKYYCSTGKYGSDGMEFLFDGKDIDGVELTTELFLSKWVTQFLTMVYRKDSFDLDIALKYKYYRDSHLTYHLLQAGKGYLFSFVGGVYNITGNGIYSSLDSFRLNEKWIAVNEELWRENNDKRLLVPYVNSVRCLIDTFVNKKEFKTQVFPYIYIHLRLTHNLKRFCRDVYHWISL